MESITRKPPSVEGDANTNASSPMSILQKTTIIAVAAIAIGIGLYYGALNLAVTYIASNLLIVTGVLVAIAAAGTLFYVYKNQASNAEKSDLTSTIDKPKTTDFAGSAESVEAISSSKVDNIKASFAAFMVELEREIFPYYKNHERSFDGHRIHGRMHVGRAVIFGEVMARYYQSQGKVVDFDYARRTTGWHDSGRKANGIDRWERESSNLLHNALVLKGVPKEEAEQKAKIIIKEKANKDSIEFVIFQSADCLDIMRPCTGNGGRHGFNPKYLSFLSNTKSNDEAQFRKDLIEEAWLFIQITEDQKMTEFNESEGFMEKLLQVIREHQDRLPILSSIL